jgi:hypothetical protein
MMKRGFHVVETFSSTANYVLDIYLIIFPVALLLYIQR